MSVCLSVGRYGAVKKLDFFHEKFQTSSVCVVQDSEVAIDVEIVYAKTTIRRL